jgi:hypothetical protein
MGPLWKKDVTMILALHANKRPKHGSFIFWTVEVADGEERREQQVDAELLRG